ncbi:MAG TPA: MoxR family ATPase [Vicinamibacterales bacterium]
MTPTTADIEAQATTFRECFSYLKTEIGRVFVGQRALVDHVLVCFFCQGHALIEGPPGLGKTLLVRTLGEGLDLTFSRIQCTPDLMPADVTGTNLVAETANGAREFSFRPGPIFANVVLADEINRATPRTQAAFLEALQERRVTVFGTSHPIAEPFAVFATQNPLEMEGTYPLPEAQLDRFMFNVVMDYLPEDDEVAVVTQTTSRQPAPIEALFTGNDVMRFHDVVRKVPIAEDLVRYAVRIAAASRPHQKGSPDYINNWVSWGAGLRAGQFLVLGAKVRALLQGRAHVTQEDIRALAHCTLRHRVLINYRAEAEGINVEKVIDKLLETVKPLGAAAR